MPKPHKHISTRRGRPSALRPAIDKGTPELAAKRSQGITGEVIDILYKNGVITEEELWCALHFRWLYTLRFGRATVQATDFTRHRHYTPPPCDSPHWKETRNAEYRSLASILQQHGFLAPLLRVAIFNDACVLHPQQNKIVKQLFLNGLDFLNRQWKG